VAEQGRQWVARRLDHTHADKGYSYDHEDFLKEGQFLPSESPTEEIKQPRVGGFLGKPGPTAYQEVLGIRPYSQQRNACSNAAETSIEDHLLSPLAHSIQTVPVSNPS